MSLKSVYCRVFGDKEEIVNLADPVNPFDVIS